MKERCCVHTDTNKTFNWLIFLKGIFIGGFVGLLFCIVLSVLFAFLLLQMNFDETIVRGFSIIILILVSIISGFTSAKILKQRGFFVGLISSFLVFLILTLIGICFLNAKFDYHLLRKMILMCSGGIFGGIIGVNIRKLLK